MIIIKDVDKEFLEDGVLLERYTRRRKALTQPLVRKA